MFDTEIPKKKMDGNTTDSTGQYSNCEPIAIVGMAMRLPGGISCAEEFWDFLINKKDGHCEVPGRSYSIKGFHHDSRPHAVKPKHGYFLTHDPSHFDASFFSITDYEAHRMDPQQRMLLEVVWECLENAGQTHWSGKDVGCYVGVYGEDWLELSLKDPQTIDRFHALGTGQFALANRLSYEFNFRGPSMTIQCACSSSLTGLHEACQAIYSGECSSAIVAGTSLILSPTMAATMSDHGVLSPSGLCRTFDKDVDGYGRGEAVNAIYIKPLSHAIRDNDPIHAVIRSTSTNCDGRTPAITTPGSESQRDLILRTYQKCNLGNICDTGFFECHGTGTRVGDTSEVSIVAELFRGKGIIVGSVKPNVGHSEGAAGISSIIKAALALRHKVIPPNVHFNTPNPDIPWQEGMLKVPLEATPWPSDRKERASVNCFGVGGSNTHVILDSAASHSMPFDASPLTCSSPQLLVISARSQKSLQQRIIDISQYANNHQESFHNLVYTLGLRREHLPHRAFAVIHPTQTLNQTLFTSIQAKPRDIVFVFTGQGSQWPGMGKQLMEEFPGFRHDVQQMDGILDEAQVQRDWSISEQLSLPKEVSRVHEVEVAQPLCTAVQIGLVNILREFGVNPSAVVGHSSGEIAAAYAAGAISLQSAILIAAFRGQVAKVKDNTGGMVAVGMGRTTVSAYLQGIESVQLACENSSSSVTLSGEVSAVETVLERIREDQPDVFIRWLPVKIGYHHSVLMKPLGPIYEDLLFPHVKNQSSMCPMFSTLTGDIITDPSALDVKYWRRNLESPVLFYSAVQKILQQEMGSAKAFIEIGPHSTLSGPLEQVFKSEKSRTRPIYIPTLVRDVEETAKLQIYTAIGKMFVQNLCFEPPNIWRTGATLTDLPRYPWQHECSYWSESRISKEWRSRDVAHHELLGSPVVELTNLEPSWRNILRLEETTWLADHVVQENVIFPAAAYIAMVGEAVHQLNPEKSEYSIRNLRLIDALILKDMEPVELITSLKPVQINDFMVSEWYSFSIISSGSGESVKHCQGQVRSGYDTLPDAVSLISHPRRVDEKKWYMALDRCGLSYGPSFRGLRDISADPTICRAAATMSGYLSPIARYTLHPTVIDQCLQLLSVAACHGLARHLTEKGLPIGIGELYIAPGGPSMQLNASAKHVSSKITSSNACMMNGGNIALSMSNILTAKSTHLSDDPPYMLQPIWKPNIDLIPTQSLLRMAPNHEEFTERMYLAGKMAILYVLLADNAIHDVITTIPHLAKWKQWVHAQACRIRQGKESLYPESQKWSQWDEMRIRNHLQDIRNTPGHETLASNTCPAFSTVVDNFADFVAERSSPLELLMENFAAIYEESARYINWSSFLQLLSHRNPNLRVLEIGAGTGSATARALSSLITTTGVPMYSSYMFTDISPGFLSMAQEKFQSTAILEYKTLDITKDPLEQGFEGQSYDLVIASNVLHATPNIGTALQHVRSLLADDGYLLLHELNPDTLTVPFIYGVLPGWWLGESDGRPDHPYVSPDRWDNELQAAGFARSEGFVQDTNPPFQQNFSMISRVFKNSTPLKSVVLVSLNHNNKWVTEVGAQFTQQGINTTWSDIHHEPPENDDVVFLLDVEEPFLYNMTPESYAALQGYLTKFKTQALWITQETQIACSDPRFALTMGFFRTVRWELQVDISIMSIDDMSGSNSASEVVNVYRKIVEQHGDKSKDQDFEFALRDGMVHINRFHWNLLSKELRVNENLDGPRVLELGSSLMDTSQWTETNPYVLEAHQVEVDITHTALNFRDIMVGMGFLGNKTDIGFEASGIIRQVAPGVTDLCPGDLVAIIGNGLFRTRAVVDRKMCNKLPDGLSLEDAATMITTFATAIYSLIHLGSLKKGQSVLIHSACGGVGLASIQICQLIGAEIFCTVGNEEKKTFLTKEFGIPANHIFDSRSMIFYPDLMRETNDRGVDIVLNSLSGTLLHTSFRCVAPCGKMIELGKRDILTHGSLDMSLFEKNRTFHAVDLSQMLEADQGQFPELSGQVLCWYREGKIKPIRPITIFKASQALEAFRYMQTGNHMGKIVVKMPDDPCELPGNGAVPVLPLSSFKSYLLVGGLGGIGRAISRWMVENGVRSIIYLSRSAGDSADDQDFIKELETQGCRIICVKGSITDTKDIQKAVSLCPYSLSGILQLTMVLKDQGFADMTYEDWRIPLKPKVDGTWNLHHATCHLKLDFFILFSSLIGLRGNNGQANYGAASAFLDSFSNYRQKLGLPCSVVDIGPVEDCGILSEDPKLLNTMRSYSAYLLREKDVIDTLLLAIHQSKPSSSNDTSSQISVGLTLSRQADENIHRHWAQGDARFSAYSRYHERDAHDPEGALTANQLKKLLAQMKGNEELLYNEENEALVKQEFLKALSIHIPGAKDMDSAEIEEMAIDSLMAVELRTWLNRNTGVTFSVIEISKTGSMGNLVRFVIDRIKNEHAPEATTAQGDEDGNKTP